MHRGAVGELGIEYAGDQRRYEVDVIGQDAEFAQRSYRGDFQGFALEDYAGGSYQSEWKGRGHRSYNSYSPRARRSAFSRASSMVPTR